jgi:hypothetical protein
LLVDEIENDFLGANDRLFFSVYELIEKRRAREVGPLCTETYAGSEKMERKLDSIG